MQERRYQRTTVADPQVDGYVEEPTDRYIDARAEPVVAAAPAAAVVTTPPAAAIDEVHATAYDPYATRRRTSYRLVQAIWLLFGIVEGVLAIRFVLKLLGANPDAGFANMIYSASGPFLAPFNNLFGNPASAGSVLKLNTIVAIVVYMMVAWLVTKVSWLLAGESRSATRTVANSTHARVD